MFVYTVEGKCYTMNDKHFECILNNYVENFDLINNPIHYEHYKWEVVQVFRDSFNINAADFHKMLLELQDKSRGLFDVKIHSPLEAMVNYSVHEPEVVRGLFRSLFAPDGGNLTKRQNKILTFIEESERLRNKYAPENPWYVQDQRSAMLFLFLNDPEDNYLFRYGAAKEFADCVEFRHDWRSGDEFRLDVYYRMCRELVKHIKSNRPLLEKNMERYTYKDIPAYADECYHLLACDIIHCGIPYDLYDGITYEKGSVKSRRSFIEKHTKALECYNELCSVEKMVRKLDDAKQFFSPLFTVGQPVHHKAFGDGVIKEVDNFSAIIFFKKKHIEKKFGILTAAAGGFITIDVPEYKEKAKAYKEVILKEGEIAQHLSFARKQMAPYAEYLDLE